jgi:hypothetical protein
MTAGESLYLLLVVAAFVAFMAALGQQSWRHNQAQRAKSASGRAAQPPAQAPHANPAH